MKSQWNQPAKTFALILVIAILTTGSSCSTAEIIGTTVGSTIGFGRTPSNDLEQVYYLGVFDPQEQIPTTIYRVIVKGQASAISRMDFGSGWVPAEMVDSLNTSIGFDPKTGISKIKSGDSKNNSSINNGRRLMLFGPEGFREAPANHRLVIVMGSSPEKYFAAIDSALGTVGKVRMEQLDKKARDQLVQEMLSISQSQKNLKDLQITTLTLKDN
jgi:hypothetical protein